MVKTNTSDMLKTKTLDMLKTDTLDLLKTKPLDMLKVKCPDRVKKWHRVPRLAATFLHRALRARLRNHCLLSNISCWEGGGSAPEPEPEPAI